MTATPANFDAIPSVTSVALGPTRIDPAAGLAPRSVVTITLADHTWGDIDTDPYRTTRAYSPEDVGTYWGKFQSRNPYYIGRPMRILTGYVAETPAWANFQSRLYVLDKIEGPDAKGQVRITGKDVLKLADDARSQCPRAVTATLTAAAITGTPATFAIDSPVADLALFPASGWVVIDSEIVAYSSRALGTFTISGRGQLGTVSANHDAAAKVGIVKYWNALKPDVIIADLLTNFTPTNPAYLPTVDWASEVGDWLPGVTYTAVITEPTGVNKLMQELLQQSTCFSWWDERVSQIKLKAIRPPRTEEVTTLTDDNFLRGSVSVTQSTDERLSRVVVYYGKKNPTIKDDEVTNYAGIYVYADADAESATEYGDVRVKTVLSRWIPDVAGATLLANRTLARFRNPTIKVRFALDAKDGALWAGDIANVTTRYIQDFSGGAVTSYAQVTEASEKESGTRFEYEASLSFFTGRYAYVTPDSQPDYLSATEAQRLRYGFICTDALLMSNGDTPYKVI